MRGLILLAALILLAPSLRAETKSWANPVSGNWGDAGNWSPEGVPTSADDVLITQDGDYTVTVNDTAAARSLTLGGTTGTQTLTVASTLTLDQASSSSSGTIIDLTAGTLTGGGAFDVGGDFNWSEGTISGTGMLTVQGTLTISGTLHKVLSQRPLTVGDTSFTSTGILYLSNGAGIQSNGTWSLMSDSLIVPVAGAGISFVNAGTLRKSAGTETSSIRVPYTGNGAVEVQTGTLSFTANATHNSALTISPGATLDFDGGTQTLSSTSSVTGDRVSFTSGTVNVSGSYDVTRTTSAGGGAIFNAASTIVGLGSLTLNGGSVSLNTGEAVSIPSLSIAGGTLAGSDDVTVTGNASWLTGGIAGTGTLAVLGTLTLWRGALTQRSLTVGDTSFTSDGILQLSSGAVIQSNGTWSFSSNSVIVFAGGAAPSFVNEGTLRKSGTGTSSIGVPYTGNGAVEVQTGTLSFTADATHNSALTISPGATLSFAGGTQTLSSTSSISGDRVTFASGTVSVNGSYDVTRTASTGTVTFNAASTIIGPGLLTLNGGSFTLNSGEAVSIPGLTIASGTLAGSDAATVAGDASWSSGTISGAGALTVQGTLTLSGGAPKDLIQRPLTVGDTSFTSAGNLLLSNGAAIQSDGTWSHHTNAGLAQGGGATGSFHNSGTFRKASTGGTTSVGIDFVNNGVVEAQTGTLSFSRPYMQTAGTTRLAGGSIEAPLGIDIVAGRLEGNGTITGNVDNDGTAGPGLSPGSLLIPGNYTQSLSGVYEVEVGGLVPGSQHDRIGTLTAALNGTLEVSLIDGFVPVSGDAFTIMTTSAARTGTFTTVTGDPIPGGPAWHVSYGATAVVLSAGPVSTADLEVFIIANPSPAVIGANLRYTATVMNNGPDAATSTIVTDILPAEVSFTAAATTLGTCSESAGTVTCDLGTLPVAQSVTITIDVNPTLPSLTVSNTISVDAEPFDAIPADNSSTVHTRLALPCPDADGDSAAVCSIDCWPFPGDVCEECDDANPARRPGLPELCNDIDDDCDFAVNDGLAGQPEMCNGLDENCNGLVDEGDPGGGAACTTGEPGVCNEGTLTCASGGLVCLREAGPGPEACNSLDDDCDGIVDETADSDGDGADDCADDCPDAFNPPSDCDGVPGTPDQQCDADADGAGDACDCSPMDFANPPPPEVGATLRLTHAVTTQLAWDPVAGVPSYNVYRGYSMAGLPFAYNQQCLTGGVDGPMAFEDATPRFGSILYYFVASRCGLSGESVLGRSSAGTTAPRPFACPVLERDADGDGTEDPYDSCPAFRNPSQSDFDADGFGDVCDNCPETFNPSQTDTDMDGLGDDCDPS
ncbi:MAG: MopE-related protein [Candidatus Polarisedimenticolia bacterium]